MPMLALAHLGVVLSILQAPAGIARPAPIAVMIASAVPAPRIIPDAAPPPPMTEITASVEAPAIETETAGDTSLAGPCELAADVQMALQTGADVSAAVARIPAAARSVSNSLLLWDGEWAAPASLGGAAALGPIRAIVQGRVRAASAACRQAPMTGPRLMVVPEATGAVVLAFGSGQWRWEELLR